MLANIESPKPVGGEKNPDIKMTVNKATEHVFLKFVKLGLLPGLQIVS